MYVYPYTEITANYFIINYDRIMIHNWVLVIYRILKVQK